MLTFITKRLRVHQKLLHNNLSAKGNAHRKDVSVEWIKSSYCSGLKNLFIRYDLHNTPVT